MAKKITPSEKMVKLLVCIIGKKDELRLPEVCNECCVATHFSSIAFGTARSNYMSYLGLNEIEKRITYSLIPNYAESRVLRAINKKLRLYLMGNGIAFTIPLSGISSIVSNAILSTPYREEANSEANTKKEQKKMHELIVAVVNQKYTDKVLDRSRAASRASWSWPARRTRPERFSWERGCGGTKVRDYFQPQNHSRTPVLPYLRTPELLEVGTFPIPREHPGA